jgi:predicted nucleotidyltransferase
MGRQRARVAEALFSRTQQRVLGLLFSQPGRRFYLGEIVREAKKGTGAVYRELARLTGSGIVKVVPAGRKKLYQADRDSLVFDELEGLVAKLSGAAPAPVLRSPEAVYAVDRPVHASVPRTKLAALCRKYHVRRLGLFGSAARGELAAPGSDVDLLVEFEPGKAPSLWAEPDMRAAFSELFGGRRVDLVPPQALENPYRRKSILRDLQVLYEA